MKKIEVSEFLDTIANTLERINPTINKHRINAYRVAAANIRKITDSRFDQMLKLKQLATLPGIGISISEKIYEFVEKGESGYLKDLSTQALRKEPFSRERTISRSIVNEISNEFKKLGLKDFFIVGSYRRGLPYVRDIDVVTLETIDQVIQKLNRSKLNFRVIASGSKKLHIFTFFKSKDIQIDFLHAEAKYLGASLLYFTGDKVFGISLRKRAINLGYKLNQYGLYKGNKLLASKEEKDIFLALKLPFITPNARIGHVEGLKIKTSY